MRARASRKLLAAALTIVLVHLLLRACGAAEHASVLVGMPLSSASYLLGPMHVLFTLAAVTLAPILVLVAGMEALFAKAWTGRGSHARKTQ